MGEVQKIFIDNNGELNTKCRGQLASIEDLKEEICCTCKIFEGLIQVKEGIFYWQDGDIAKKILIECGDTEDLDDIEGEYIVVFSLEKVLYEEFISHHFDEVLMRVVDKEMIENTLNLKVKMVNPIWTYEFKLSLDNKGEVEIEADYSLDQEERDKQFGMGKYTRNIESLMSFVPVRGM